MISRRTFLRGSLGASALLGGAALFRSASGYHLDPSVAARLSVLSPKEFLILHAVVTRIVAGDLETTLFVDRYLGNLDLALQKDLRALCHLVEHGSGPWCLSPTRFTRMSDDQKDAVLRDWQSSRLVFRRRCFQALRSLSFLAYYRTQNTWSELGYTGPVLPRPPLVAP